MCVNGHPNTRLLKDRLWLKQAHNAYHAGLFHSAIYLHSASRQSVNACFYSCSMDDFKYELGIIGKSEIDMEEFEWPEKKTLETPLI